ncbi:23S rRNA (guanosine(2251)-2'-O)-methyltransferase RlmB [Caulobacter endophyticus]|uniref:23S rRNA (guanosine(2251)-2'-O)-methyltransferase RlmB n=1 Tax=Caulobacter endophyticus TaxID=2172652 RepID=UPI002410352C|nr:23S rRNA (guanosine(2251)-2'-O)-methyltransferase RlmB [Caulobacter endophyticus]MDG2530199.1 23S rRNA (guanosine(2251)-2'-O)-methyltransferase RlmB [Caulobacter endophyticus]
MSSHSERNDRRRPKAPEREIRAKPQKTKTFSKPAGDDKEWIWGNHAVEAALSNPARPPAKRLLVTPDRAKRLAPNLQRHPALQVFEPGDIARLLPQGAVHQGIAMKVAEPEPLSLAELGTPAKGVIVMLDQITDPQNVGAIFRSAAAFGVKGAVLQDRHAPALSGVLAKTAVGAVDKVPYARVVNLSRALEELAELGWRAVALAGEAEHSLEEVLDGGPTVLVLGSEGEGVRRLVAEHCDAMGKIPMPGGFESLNVSAAAAIALYETSRVRVTGEIGS